MDSLYDLQVIEVVETALRIREAIFSLISDKTPSMPTCYDVNINTSNPNYFDVSTTAKHAQALHHKQLVVGDAMYGIFSSLLPTVFCLKLISYQKSFQMLNVF